AAHKAKIASGLEKRPVLVEEGPRQEREFANTLGRKELRAFGKSIRIVEDVALDRAAVVIITARRARMALCYRIGNIRNEFFREPFSRGQFVECRGLVEATHMHRPLDDLTVASDAQPAIRQRDRHDAKIDGGGVLTIDGDFTLAGELALLKCRKIHE